MGVADQRIELAEQLADDIRRSVPCEAIAVFGSTARGDATQDSDLDLLVVVTRATDARRVSRLCREVSAIHISPVVHLWSSFERLRCDDWLFVRHLADEAVPLWDPTNRLEKRWRVSFPGHHAVIDEIRRHSASIDRLQDIDRYGGDLLFPLAATYGLAKRIAMLANARADVQIFNRDQALIACAALIPELAEDIQHLATLAPFYASTRGIALEQAPFPSDHAERELERCTAALRRLVAASCRG